MVVARLAQRAQPGHQQHRFAHFQRGQHAAHAGMRHEQIAALHHRTVFGRGEAFVAQHMVGERGTLTDLRHHLHLRMRSSPTIHRQNQPIKRHL